MRRSIYDLAKSILARIRARRVLQWTGGYLVAAWGLLEATKLFSVEYGWPSQIFDSMAVLAGVGVVACIVVAWNHGERGTQQFVRLEALVLLGLLLLAIVLLIVIVPAPSDADRPTGTHDLAVPRVAILYFDDRTPDGNLRHLADGLTEHLINELSRSAAIGIVSSNGVKAFKERDIRPDSIARVLGVIALVAGSLNGSNDRVGVYVELIDGETGLALASDAIEPRPIGDFLDIETELAREVAVLIRNGLGREIELRGSARGITNPAAYEVYRLAVLAFEDFSHLFQLGDAQAARRALLKSDSLLVAASALDPSWPAPMIFRGRVAFRRGWLGAVRGDVEAARTGFDLGSELANEALARNPGDSQALKIRGLIFQNAHAFQTPLAGVREEDLLDLAVTDFESALSTNATDAEAWKGLGEVRSLQGESAAAIVALERAYSSDPYLDGVAQVMFRLYELEFQRGNDRTAREWCDRGRESAPGNWVFSYCGLQLLAWSDLSRPDPDAAVRLGEETLALYPEAIRHSFHPDIMLLVAAASARAGEVARAAAMLDDVRGALGLEIAPLEAAVLAAIGRRQEALDRLEAYVEAYPSSVESLRKDRLLSPLTGEVRFQRLMQTNRRLRGGDPEIGPDT